MSKKINYKEFVEEIIKEVEAEIEEATASGQSLLLGQRQPKTGNTRKSYWKPKLA